MRRRGLRRHGKDSGEQQRSRGKRRRTKLGLDERGWGRVSKTRDGGDNRERGED